MNELTWQMVDEDIRSASDCARNPLGNPDDREIQAAARELGCVFCDDYVEFLRRYGAASIGGYDIYGLRPIGEVGQGWSLVDVTKFFRDDDWPDIDGWYIISEDGYGNPIGIAPDGRVMISDHDHGCVDEMSVDFEHFLLDWCFDDEDF